MRAAARVNVFIDMAFFLQRDRVDQLGPNVTVADNVQRHQGAAPHHRTGVRSIAPVVVGSVEDPRMSACSAGRLALISIMAEKQHRARAAIQRTPLAVRVRRLDMRPRLTLAG